MDARQIENREIWKAVKGSEKLFEIYTYFPTLHDAVIRKIESNFEKRELYFTVDYCDFIEAPGDEVATRFTICWRDVQNANFNWYAEDLYGMKLAAAGAFIKTSFEKYPFGFDGEIISGEIEITEIEIEPEKEDNDRGIIRFSIN